MSLILALWPFQYSDSGYIAPLEPPADPPQNAAACVDMENNVVLGSDITEDVRVFVGERDHISFLSRRPGSIC